MNRVKKMKEIIIVGAGGFGRELLQWIKEINKLENRWEIKGFIDDNLEALDNYDCKYKILGKIKDWEPSKNEVFACAIANPKIKEKVVCLLKTKEAVFESIIHPSAVIGESNKIGEGFIAYPNSVVTTNVVIGDFVTLLSSGVGHDAKVGDFSTISSFCDITGYVNLGKRVFMGSHGTIIPSKKIGDDVYIGAGSVVISNLKNNIRVFGNPAKKIDF